MWLVDGGSEFVFHALGYPYAIACGPAVGGFPGLCVATAARAGAQAHGQALPTDADADDTSAADGDATVGRRWDVAMAADWFQQTPLL